MTARCTCCHPHVHACTATRTLIELDGWWYPNWSEFARVIGLPRDVARKRVERRMCLREPVTRRERRVTRDVHELAAMFCNRRIQWPTT